MLHDYTCEIVKLQHFLELHTYKFIYQNFNKHDKDLPNV